MATFSTNQVKHLYVAKAVDSSLDTIGDIKFSAAGDNQIIAKYVGNDGIVRTDLTTPLLIFKLMIYSVQ